MTDRFEAPKGTFDYLPPLAEVRARVELTMLEQARLAGYQRMETPIFEETGLFARGVGQSTDVVQKEMYTFTDKGGRSVTLRPELTAGAMRALIEHGRLGGGEPAVDADVVLVGHEVFRALGIEVTLLLTSLGNGECRPVYRERLLEFLRGLGDKLPSEVRARAEHNPLRVLDMKDPYVQELTADAPLMRDSLCADCKAHDDTVRSLLADAGVAWVEAPRLVRGLDYYMRTTFEWQADTLEAAQNALGGGGRYDGLSELVGGPPAPGVGWALGLDRTVLALERAGRLPEAPVQLQALVLPLTPAARGRALTLVRDLRRAGVAADQPYAERTLRGHMKAAAKAGARAVVLLGDEELAAGEASVRDMAARDQVRVPLDSVVPAVARIAAAAGEPARSGPGGAAAGLDPSETDDQGAAP